MGKGESDRRTLGLLSADFSSLLSRLDEVYTVLRKGGSLIKYGRQGNPKYYYFNVTDNALVWKSKGQDKAVRLSRVVNILPGQQTAVFRKHRDQSLEHLSFSLIYKDSRDEERSVDLVCVDQDQYKIWLVGLIKLVEEQREAVEYQGIRRRLTTPQQDATACEAVESAFEMVGDAIPMLDSFSEQGLAAEPAHLETPPGDLYLFGKLGSLQYSVPQQLEGSLKLDIKQAACSNRMAVIITRKGQIYTVGEDLGLHTCSLSPRALPAASGYRASFVTCSGAAAFIISSEDGSVLSWGLNQAGLLGPWTVSGLFHLRPMPNLFRIKQISCGPTHVACISEQGEVMTWGDGYAGKLGHGNILSIQSPKVVQFPNTVVGKWVSCGHFHTCVVGNKGELYSWGGDFGNLQESTSVKKSNHKGCLGNGTLAGCSSPVSVNVEGCSEFGMREVCCGEFFTVVLDEEGWVYQSGSMGVGGKKKDAPWEDSKVFVRVGGLLQQMRVDKLSCGSGHVAVIASRVGVNANTEGPLLLTWGRGSNGQLGIGVSQQGCASPVVVEDVRGERLRNVVCGGDATMVIVDYNQNTAVMKASQQTASSVRRALSRNKSQLSVAIPLSEFDYQTPSSTPNPTPSSSTRPSPLMIPSTKQSQLRRRSNWTPTFLTTSQWRTTQHRRRVFEDDIERSHNSYTAAFDDTASQNANNVDPFCSEHGSRQAGGNFGRRIWSMSPVGSTTPSPSDQHSKTLFRQRSASPPALAQSTLQKLEERIDCDQQDDISEEGDSISEARVESPSAKSDSYTIGGSVLASESAIMSAANAVFPSLDLSSCTFRMVGSDMPRNASLNPQYSDVDFDTDVFIRQERSISQQPSPKFYHYDSFKLRKENFSRQEANRHQRHSSTSALQQMSQMLLDDANRLKEMLQEVKQVKDYQRKHLDVVKSSLQLLEEAAKQESTEKSKHRRSRTQDSWSQVDFIGAQFEVVSPRAGKQDRIGFQEVEVEKGVYITYKQADGGNQLIRLRFSQAWKSRQKDLNLWWRQNRVKIMQRYNILNEKPETTTKNQSINV